MSTSIKQLSGLEALPVFLGPFNVWVHQFLRQVLTSKTRVSCFVMRSDSACRSDRTDSAATALFPIPPPFLDAFGVGPDLSTQRKRELQIVKKLVHLIAMALHYEPLGFPMPTLKFIRRRPSTRLPMDSDVPQGVPYFSTAGCGRKFFQFGAILRETIVANEQFWLKLSSLYHHGATNAKGFVSKDVFMGLRPCLSANVDTSRALVSC